MQVWNELDADRWKYRTQRIAKNSPPGHHRTTLSGCIFATNACIDNLKKIVKQQYLLTSSHNMVNVGPLAAEIGLPVWDTPANFNGFRVLASLLHRRRSTDVNQTFHDIWPSPVLLHYIYTLGGGAWASAKLCGVVQGMKLRNFYRGRHSYSAARPSRLASADILVTF